MKKRQTKSMRFRQLLPEIEQLLETNLHEAVVDILKDQYDLDLNIDTFRNYYYRYGRKNSKNHDTVKKPLQELHTEDSINSTDDTDDEVNSNLLRKIIERQKHDLSKKSIFE